MILKRISPYIAVDEIIIENSQKYLHFITHFDHRFVIPDDWGSIIYTSQYLAKLLSLKKSPIPMKYFRILPGNMVECITLPADKTSLRVRMFGKYGLFGNVMFHIQNPSFEILYTGPFASGREFILNDHFLATISTGIDELYVDNRRAKSTGLECLQSVANKISTIQEKNPDFTIILNTLVHGYEDLLYILAREQGHKIRVGENLYDVLKKLGMHDGFSDCVENTNLCVGRAKLTANELKRRFNEEKRLTVCFTKSNVEHEHCLAKNFGLYVFEWSPHPSLFDLFGFIDFVKPKKVYGIYEDKLPKCLEELTRNS